MSISFNEGKFFRTENGQGEELTETYLLNADKKKIHLIKQSDAVKKHKDNFNALLEKVESLKKEGILNESFSKALDIYQTEDLKGKQIEKYIPILFMGKIVVCKTPIEALFLRIFGGKKDCVRDLFKKYVESKTFEEGRLKILKQQKPIEATIARIQSDIKVVNLFSANGEDYRFNSALAKLNNKLDELNEVKRTQSRVAQSSSTAYGFSITQQTPYDDESTSIDDLKSGESDRFRSDSEDDDIGSDSGESDRFSSVSEDDGISSDSGEDGDISSDSEDDDDFNIFGPPDEDE